MNLNRNMITNDILMNINKRYQNLYSTDSNGRNLPHVCLICDEFIQSETISRVSLKFLHSKHQLLIPVDNVSPPLKENYNIYDRNRNFFIQHDDSTWVRECVLSTRSHVDTSKQAPFIICNKCKQALTRNYRPAYAISNNYAIGEVPPFFESLTDVEWAVLSPIKIYGYCFSYTGGKNKQLKGSLMFLKHSLENVARLACRFQLLGLTDHIVVMLHGRMTSSQRHKARKKNKIRTRLILQCVEWLANNNEQWTRQGIILDNVSSQLKNPILVDHSQLDNGETSSTNNIENTESFEVFFPDASMSALNGGQENIENYQNIVKEITRNGFNAEVMDDMNCTPVPEYLDDNLVLACPMQFPFGRGGINEKRQRFNGSISTNTDVLQYVQHISKLSIPNIHTSLFSLILFNLKMKQEMVKNASWRVRNGSTLRSLTQELTSDAVDAAISSRRSGRRSYNENRSGDVLLDCVDVVSSKLPHTNRATKSARLHAESMQHMFGLPSIFLTVTPDDDTNFLVEILTRRNIYGDHKIENQSQDEIQNKMKQRTMLRLQFPGICSYFFELALQVVIEEVIGWDYKSMIPIKEKKGLFGNVEAFTCTIEEQGRTTLHGHFQIWVPLINKWRDDLFKTKRIMLNASRNIKKFTEKISNNQLIHNIPRKKHHSIDIFPHQCSVANYRNRRQLELINHQQIRNLRHSEAEKFCEGGKQASCQECTKTWNSKELIFNFLKNYLKIDLLKNFDAMGMKYLKTLAIDYQKSNEPIVSEKMKIIIDAGWNFHCHNKKSCFEKSRKRKSNDDKNSYSNELDSECRYKYPKKPRLLTSIENATSEEKSWYTFYGERNDKHIKEVCMKRHSFDIFQNNSCPTISHSKFSCNSNITLVMPGPIGQYVFKYVTKDTQADDVESCDNIVQAVKKNLSKDFQDRTESSKAIGLILSATHANGKNNVVSGTMAMYLVRNKSRFIFSHSSVFCPIRDLKKVLRNQTVSSTINYFGSRPYYKCWAMDYLCRPDELESLNVYNFYRNYEAINQSTLSEGELLQFSSKFKQHPSYIASEEKFIQGIRKRKKQCLIKLFQYDFPDSASFHGNIMNDETIITEEIEYYCELVLILFVPFREMGDLQIENSFTKKFRKEIRCQRINESAMRFLQNIQDAKANNLRHTGDFEDDLARNTEPFDVSKYRSNVFKPDQSIDDKEEDEEDDENTTLQGQVLEAIISHFNDEISFEGIMEQEVKSHGLPLKIDFDEIKNRGSYGGGNKCVALLRMNKNANFVKVEEINETLEVQDSATASIIPANLNTTPTKSDITRILFTRVQVRKRSFQDILRFNQEVDILEANGSARSIVHWGEMMKLDKGQRKAFEVLCSHFVLSFYDDADNIPGLSLLSNRARFSLERNRLNKLGALPRRSSQLIAFLHGAAGSGKTTVIDLVIEYAREYCSCFENYKFTSRTIVVTAMTGVAATLLGGETTHSALHLFQTKELDYEAIECWEDTKMVIIDEISFASSDDITKIDDRLRVLKQQPMKRFGNCHVIFSGDLRQLEPVGNQKLPLYEETCPEFSDWVNCYIELNGMHRFKNDESWGLLLKRFRDGKVTPQDINTVNERTKFDENQLPSNLKYASFFNKDRDAINTALFLKRCDEQQRLSNNTDGCIMIFCDNVLIRNSNQEYIAFQGTKSFWENCGESDIKTGQFGGRLDPVLKLYSGCMVMMTINSDVKNGKANGTQLIVQNIVLKENTPITNVQVGSARVRSVLASDVSHIVVRHINDRVVPSTFTISSSQRSFKAKLPKPRIYQTATSKTEFVDMKANIFPIVVNNATTGHKLQGCSVENLFVHNWHYSTNWPYVVMSRVKTIKGLFLRRPLLRDLKHFEVPKGYLSLIKKFKMREPIQLDEDEYSRLCHEQ